MARLICDVMLGRLARWLRLLGHDTLYDNAAEDDRLIEIAEAEQRWLLTSDRPLSERSEWAILIVAHEIDDQLLEVCRALDLLIDPDLSLKRCSVCNGELEARDKAAVDGRVPAYVFETEDRFAECPSCERVYWTGTHGEKLRGRLARLRERMAY